MKLSMSVWLDKLNELLKLLITMKVNLIIEFRMNLENLVKIATMGLDFYMRRNLSNVELFKKEKETFKSEKKSKNYKFLARKKKVSYVEMKILRDNSENKYFEVDLTKLRKRPPYVCPSLKKVSNVDKVSEIKHKDGKKYSFDISKSEQIFNVLRSSKINN
ncbi:hypothetical protein Ahy_A06g029831 [Arachis hypogaea]|uniref:Uncharacterized protein n=1 Tax=Arachis hypogaea TaxID=3818 RepID=A0A445CUE4_ARAHY|nr:hypothetical protein Ahy_A06g029831 [Arachis hypogaea]